MTENKPCNRRSMSARALLGVVLALAASATSARITVAKLEGFEDRDELPLCDGSIYWAPSRPPDARAIYFDRQRRMFGIGCDPDTGGAAGGPEALPIEGFVKGEYRRQFELLPDRQRLLMLFPLEGTATR